MCLLLYCVNKINEMQQQPALKTRLQIAQELNIDRKTLYNKLKKAGIFL